jgi:hypothetical protein
MVKPASGNDIFPVPSFTGMGAGPFNKLKLILKKPTKIKAITTKMGIIFLIRSPNTFWLRFQFFLIFIFQ